MKRIFLDAREMKHPEPLQQALHHLQVMSEEEYFYMIHRKNPIPLLETAKEKNFTFLVEQDKSETWHILISKNQKHNLKELLDV